MKTASKLLYPLSFLFVIFLTACSNSNNNRVNTLQEVQRGTIVSINQVYIKPKPIKPRGNVGVSVGSGGHSGIYGAIDIMTLGSLLGVKRKGTVMQEVIIKRPNGTLIAVTQPYTTAFHVGEAIKILRRGSEARVIR